MQECPQTKRRPLFGMQDYHSCLAFRSGKTRRSLSRHRRLYAWLQGRLCIHPATHKRSSMYQNHAGLHVKAMELQIAYTTGVREPPIAEGRERGRLVWKQDSTSKMAYLICLRNFDSIQTVVLDDKIVISKTSEPSAPRAMPTTRTLL